MASNQEQLALLIEKVGYPEETHPVIVHSNEHATELEGLLQDTLGELVELEAEHQVVPLSQKWWLEFTDLVVFLRSVKRRLVPNFSVETVVFSVDGQFRGSFDSLKEQIVNLGEGNPERNLHYLLTDLLSMLKYLDANLQAEIYVRLINFKLFFNKEARFLKIEPGMKEQDILDKKTHVFKALRILRKFLFKVTGEETLLQPFVTDFFAKEILDWRNSEPAIQKIHEKLPLFQAKVRAELNKLSPDSAKRDSNLELKLMIAGGVPLSGQALAAGQNPSTSDTLGKVVFPPRKYLN